MKESVQRLYDNETLSLPEPRKAINDRLKSLYGTEVDGRPRFRLVWAPDQKVRRLGIFDDYYGKIFLRTVKEVREVKKWQFVRDRWIIERLLPKLQVYNQNEVWEPAENRGYWCIYVFETSQKYGFKPLPVIWKAIELICQAALDQKITIKPGDVKAWHNSQLQKEADEILEKEWETPSSLAYGQGVSMFGKKSKSD